MCKTKSIWCITYSIEHRIVYSTSQYPLPYRIIYNIASPLSFSHIFFSLFSFFFSFSISLSLSLSFSIFVFQIVCVCIIERKTFRRRSCCKSNIISVSSSRIAFYLVRFHYTLATEKRKQDKQTTKLTAVAVALAAVAFSSGNTRPKQNRICFIY